jgi:hypothetical protein
MIRCVRFAKYPKPLVPAGRKVPSYMRRPSEGSYDGVPGSWTTISTPPYISTLAIWPSVGRWTGGGAFASEREILISEAPCGTTPIQNVPIPRTVRITSGGRTRGSRMSAYQPTAVESERHVSIAETLQLSGFFGWTGSASGVSPICSSQAMDASSGFEDYARVAESVPHFSDAPRRFAGHDF